MVRVPLRDHSDTEREDAQPATTKIGVGVGGRGVAQCLCWLRGGGGMGGLM